LSGRRPIFNVSAAVGQVFSAISLLVASVTLDAAVPKQIDIRNYRLTFAEEFNTLDVSAHGPSRWTAHTWWNGDFGDAAFADPTPGFPFTVANGVLTITAFNDGNGWRAGLLSSVDPQGRGFAQQYGYFEMRAKLPEGPGVWPAFWLVSTGRRQDIVEVDLMEYYGHAPDRYFSSLHVWKNDETGSSSSITAENGVPSGQLTAGFHLYGAEVTPEAIGFYLDRRLVRVMPTPPQHRRPLGLLVNLTLGGGWPSGHSAVKR
jgi:beta-glucanase (GH16 family)